MNRRTHWLTGALLGGLLALPIEGKAGAPAPGPAATEAAKGDGNGEDPATAAALYRAGNAEYSLGHYREALEKFEHAFRAKQVPAMLFNIAQCHRQLKQFEQAAITYKAFLRLSPDSPQAKLASSLLAQVEDAMRAQESARRALPTDATGEDPVPHISVRPTEPPHTLPLPGASAAKSSQPPAPTAQPPARPAPLSKAPQPPAAATALRAAEPAAEEAGPRRATWIAAAGTVVALGAGAAFGLMAKSTSASLASDQLQRDQVDAKRSDLHSQAQKANLLMAVGAGLAVVTGALFVLHF